MPPELKKAISNINEMTCENCVFSITTTTYRISYCHCVTPNMQMGGVEEINYCSEGQWLWFGVWFYEPDNEGCQPKVWICDYQELYQLFAREVER